MTRRIVVTGTDTDVGKTVFSAALASAVGGSYWKPVQSGLADGGDSASVSALTGMDASRILPEAYRLTTPCSPHRAARIDGVSIDPARLRPPACADVLVIEGAGGALVPITRDLLFADLFADWGDPAVIVARTTLGTINHSLLTAEALRARGVPVLGVAFIGDANEDTEETIAAIGMVKRLGRLPLLDPLTPDALSAAFRENFRIGDFS